MKTPRNNPYVRPVKRKARAPAPAAGASPPSVAISGIEIVQSIQDLSNSVRLIAGKPTLVRVYLRGVDLNAPLLVTGELTLRPPGAAAQILPATNRVRLTASPPTLAEQRADLEASLNFQLPPQAIVAGQLDFALTRAHAPGAADDLAVSGPNAARATFLPSPPLRLRVVGLRYRRRGSQQTVSPDALHFSYLRSFLLRAYPIASLDWSQIVVDANFGPPFGDNASDLANMQLLAMRSREVAAGMDPRTHYYGLVSDDGGATFMRGSAVLNQQTRVFGVVASGPAGTPNGWVGDSDASYADWYGAHEIGHTFQRFHPGFPPGSQDATDTAFPYPDGMISPPGNIYLGLDVGDPALGVAMRVLDGEKHHDVMTYADHQWISRYTYEAIHDRLMLDEAAVSRGAPPPVALAGRRRTGVAVAAAGPKKPLART